MDTVEDGESVESEGDEDVKVEGEKEISDGKDVGVSKEVEERDKFSNVAYGKQFSLKVTCLEI